MSDTIATAMLPTKTLVDALKKFQDIPRGLRRLNDMISISIGDDKIVLFSTDLETALRVTLPATTNEGRDKLVVGYKALVAAVKAIKATAVVLQTAPEWLAVTDERGTTSTRCDSRIIAWDDYPEFPNRLAARGVAYTVVPGRALAEGLRMVMPAMATGDTRYALNGVCLDSDGGGIALVTSDTHRLHHRYLPVIHEVFGELDGLDTVMIAKAARWLSKCAAETSEVRLLVTESETYFSGDNWDFYGRLIDGRFPDYRSVVEPLESLPGKLAVNRLALLAALKDIQGATNEESRRVTIAPSEDGVSIRLVAERGTSASIPAAALKCPEADFVCDFLIDLLAVARGGFVTLRFGAGRYKGPVHLYEDGSLLLLMPMNGSGPGGYVYTHDLSGPDQDCPGASVTSTAPVASPAGAAAVTKRPPSFKAVVTHAKADPGYLSSLLAALGIQAAAV